MIWGYYPAFLVLDGDGCLYLNYILPENGMINTLKNQSVSLVCQICLGDFEACFPWVHTATLWALELQFQLASMTV